MHELSIAMQLLDAVRAVAAEHHAACVELIDVHVGAMKLIVPEALEAAWEAVTEGTVAEGSRLVLTAQPLRGTCRECGRDFEPTLDNFLCPACGQADVEIVAGDEIVLMSVVCRTEKGASPP